MKSTFLFLVFFIATNLHSQVEQPKSNPKKGSVNEEEIFDVVDQMPDFPGGFGEMMKFIQGNFEYPRIAREMGDQGTVYIQFVIERNGKVTNVEVIKGVTEELDLEAIRVVKLMPYWIPGIQKGKKVRARFTLPIKCRLDDVKKKKKKKKKNKKK